MKKFTVLVLLSALTLGSCQAINFPTNPTPSVDVQGTTNAMIQTANAQTLTAQPSPTTAPPTATVTPILAEASPTAVTPTTDLFASTPATATSGPTATGVIPTATFTATSVPGQATPFPTLAIRTYGTLPPLNRPYTQITIFNRTKAQCYISLQIETDQGYTIIEYPVKKMVQVLIPTGEYTYVVWVGGRQFVGYFHASQDIESVINIYRDKVVTK